MDKEFIEHFVKQIIKNKKTLTKYFTSDEIYILQTLCDDDKLNII